MTEAFVEHNGILIPESAVPPPPPPPPPTRVCTHCRQSFVPAFKTMIGPSMECVGFKQCPGCRVKRSEGQGLRREAARRRKRSTDRDRQKMLDRMNGGFDPRLDDRLAVGFAMMGDEVDAGVARLLAAQGWPGRWEV